MSTAAREKKRVTSSAQPNSKQALSAAARQVRAVPLQRIAPRPDPLQNNTTTLPFMNYNNKPPVTTSVNAPVELSTSQSREVDDIMAFLNDNDLESETATDDTQFDVCAFLEQACGQLSYG